MIDVKNIFVSYGKTEVLHGVSFSFEKGKLTSVIGKNGSGKSTLLKSMLGIIPCKHGEIYIDGVNRSSMKRNAVAKKISYLEQGRTAPDMTVGEMVLHGRYPYLEYPKGYTEKDREKAFSAMEKMGISELGKTPVSVLSYGMRQKAYIAMALAQETDYILLDEPTAYLDIEHQLLLMKLLRELADSGKGVVAVIHDLPLALSFSDAVAVISDGKKEIFDVPQKVCESKSLEKIFGVSVCFENGKYSYRYGV